MDPSGIDVNSSATSAKTLKANDTMTTTVLMIAPLKAVEKWFRNNQNQGEGRRHIVQKYPIQNLSGAHQKQATHTQDSPMRISDTRTGHLELGCLTFVLLIPMLTFVNGRAVSRRGPLSRSKLGPDSD
jgi:hypothetical protein